MKRANNVGTEPPNRVGQRGIPIQTLRWVSLVPATVGLFLLYLYSMGREVPVVRVDEITPAMNFATVRLVGEVVRSPVYLSSGALLFEVDDGSGRITILVDRVHLPELLAAETLPERGDRIDLTGSLSVQAERGMRVRLSNPRGVRLFAAPRQPPLDVSIRNLAPALEGRVVQVSGRLVTVRVPGPGSRAPTVLVIDEDGETAEVILWNDLLQALGNQLPLPGRRITVTGPVRIFRGSLQIQLNRVRDLVEEFSP